MGNGRAGAASTSQSQRSELSRHPFSLVLVVLALITLCILYPFLFVNQGSLSLSKTFLENHT